MTTRTPAAQLDREIAEALASSGRPKKPAPSGLRLGQGPITAEQARERPRFDFIAHWLAVVTRRKDGRDLAQGKRVRRANGRWQIVYPNGLVEYETPDADRLFDYARRGSLGRHIRDAEEFRVLAHQEQRR